MIKHTPGPWGLQQRPDQSIYNVFAPRYTTAFAVVQNVENAHGTMGSVETHANARLIAAAPELLDVLLFIQRGLQSGQIKAPPFLDFSNPNAESFELQHPLTLVNAVIAKATGGAA